MSLYNSTFNTSIRSAISTNNSTTTPLGISGTFTGTVDEIKDYATISIQTFSDVASATDGFAIDWSTDGINFDDNDVYTIPANKGKYFTFGPQARYMRIRYTNGLVAQTVFRLQVIFHQTSTKPSSMRIGDTITDEDDSELVKAIITGKDTNNVFRNIATTTDGRMKISTEPGDIPAGSAVVDVAADGTVTGNSSSDTTYVITNAKTLLIRGFNGGGAAATGGDNVELYYDPAGTGVGMTLIRVAYVPDAGGNFDLDLNFQAVGNGTRAIRVRRTRSGGGNARISAFWSGLES